MRRIDLALFGAILLALSAVSASAQPTQLTSHEGSCSTASPAPNSAATLVAFSSTCDWTGENPDHNREIYQVAANGNVVQLTDTQSCTNANPVSNLIGDVVAFDSDCDMGENADHNVEIFVAILGEALQVTHSSGCMNLGPSIDTVGNVVAFDSDCDLAGGNPDASVEIFRAVLFGSITQITSDTSTTGCVSFHASSDESGETIAFESDCDLTGSNPDQINEIFRYADGTVTQLTSSGDDPCINSAPALSEDGSTITFESDCDPLGTNADHGTEIFTVDAAGRIVQLTNDPGTTTCESLEPVVSSAVDAVAFSSYCDPLGKNPDGSFQLFRVMSGAMAQITGEESCASMSPAIAAGARAVVFVSTCDPLGLNPDLGPELFSVNLCACGAPVSRDQPLATDALFTLKAAVGAGRCAACDCDVTGDKKISASDSLLILRKAVGQDVTFMCP